MEKKEFVYKTVQNPDDSSTSLTADVYYNPESSTPCPIALLFHSGGFVVGSKNDISPTQIHLLISHNFIVIVPNYRLCPTILAPEGPVQDSLDSYEWARTHLPNLLSIPLNPTKLVALGTSCGGTLAHHMSKSPVPPAAILDIAGIKYLDDPWYTKGILPPGMTALPPLEQSFLDKVYSEVPPPVATPLPWGPSGMDFSQPRFAWMFDGGAKGMHYSSIVPHGETDLLDPVALWRKKGRYPPTCFLHGTGDTLVDVEFAKRAYGELRERGGKAECILVEGKDHGFDEHLQRGEEGFEELERAVEFLRRYVA